MRVQPFTRANALPTGPAPPPTQQKHWPVLAPFLRHYHDLGLIFKLPPRLE